MPITNLILYCLMYISLMIKINEKFKSNILHIKIAEIYDRYIQYIALYFINILTNIYDVL